LGTALVKLCILFVSSVLATAKNLKDAFSVLVNSVDGLDFQSNGLGFVDFMYLFQFPLGGDL
jgi:hypothetical protein